MKTELVKEALRAKLAPRPWFHSVAERGSVLVVYVHAMPPLGEAPSTVFGERVVLVEQLPVPATGQLPGYEGPWAPAPYRPTLTCAEAPGG